MRLNHQNEASWAVIERPSGAIVVDERNRLIFRLLEREARERASALTVAVQTVSVQSL